MLSTWIYVASGPVRLRRLTDESRQSGRQAVAAAEAEKKAWEGKAQDIQKRAEQVCQGALGARRG